MKNDERKSVTKKIPNIAEGLNLDKYKDSINDENKKQENNNELENKMNKIKNLYQIKKDTDFQKKIKFDKINQLKEEL